MDASNAGRACLLVSACLAALLAAGCSGDTPVAAPPPPAPSSPPPVPTTSAPPSTPPPPPPSSSAPASPKPRKETVPAGGSCGTVTAASGQTLQVLDSTAGGVDCALAKKVVTDFHQKIAGRQSANSNEPVSDTVDGWLCVSGPPAAQGGTTCGKQELTVLAAVVPAE